MVPLVYDERTCVHPNQERAPQIGQIIRDATRDILGGSFLHLIAIRLEDAGPAAEGPFDPALQTSDWDSRTDRGLRLRMVNARVTRLLLALSLAPLAVAPRDRPLYRTRTS